MADNVQAEAVVSAGVTFATDEDTANSRHVPYTKLMFGGDGTFTILSASDPLPVDITTATIDVMLGTDFSAVFGTSSLIATDGSAALTIGLQALGTDGTNAQIISTNSSGHVNIADGGNAITVDGTVTANLSATDNAVLDSIQTAVEIIDNPVATISATPVMRVAVFDAGDSQVTSFGGGTQYAEDDALGTTPTGTVALAKRDDALSTLTPVEGDAVPHRVDANGALWVVHNGSITADLGATDNAVLDSIDAATTAIQTATEIIDNAIYVDDADWTDSTSSHMLTGGVYQSAPQTITDGDTGPFQVTSNGYLITSVNGTVTVASHDVTNAGTFAVQVDGDALTALQLIDDGIFADDAAFTLGSSKVMVGGAIRDDALSTLTAVEADAVPLRVDANGALWAVINGTVTVGSHDVTNAGTFAVQVDGDALTALQTIDNSIFADDSAFTLTSSSVNMAGAIRDDALSALAAVEGDAVPLRTDANGALWVVHSGDITIADGGNTITVDGTVTANAGTGTFTVGGVADHDAAVSGNPVLLGGWANEAAVSGNQVADGDVSRIRTDQYGRLQVVGPAAVSVATSDDTAITTATETSAIAAPGAGKTLRIKYINFSNSSATVTDVSIVDGSGGVKYYRNTLTQYQAFAHSIPGGFDLTANTACYVFTSGAGSVHYTIEYETVDA